MLGSIWSETSLNYFDDGGEISESFTLMALVGFWTDAFFRVPSRSGRPRVISPPVSGLVNFLCSFNLGEVFEGRYSNLKEEVGGSTPGCEMSSLLDIKLAMWSIVSLACRPPILFFK